MLPRLRDDLALSYTQVGLLFTVPGLISFIGEPLIGLLGDTPHRRSLVVGGIVATAVGLFLTGIAQTFAPILLAFSILYVASGAYVNLTQGTLIDHNPSRAAQTMARWTLLGWIGVTMAPLGVTGLFFLGYGWRELYLVLAGIAAFYSVILFRQRFDAHAGAMEVMVSPRQLWQNLIDALKSRELLRWILLAELADLMLDKLLEVTGLYFHDVVGVSLAEASGAVAVFTIAGLVGNTLLVPALERVSGLLVLRVTAVIVLALYFAWLLVPVVWLKFVLIGLISFCTASWFPILRAKTYQVMPGRSGLIISVTSLGSLFSYFVPALLGGVADTFGLQWAMWLLAIGPLALILGLPRK